MILIPSSAAKLSQLYISKPVQEVKMAALLRCHIFPFFSQIQDLHTLVHKNIRKIFFSIYKLYVVSDSSFKTKKLPLFQHGTPNSVSYFFNKHIWVENMAAIMTLSWKANNGKFKSF